VYGFTRLAFVSSDFELEGWMWGCHGGDSVVILRKPREPGHAPPSADDFASALQQFYSTQLEASRAKSGIFII